MASTPRSGVAAIKSSAERLVRYGFFGDMEPRGKLLGEKPYQKITVSFVDKKGETEFVKLTHGKLAGLCRIQPGAAQVPGEQLSTGFFGDQQKARKWWQPHWWGMPEYLDDDLSPFRRVVLYFYDRKDVLAFGELIGQKLSPRCFSVWFPKRERRDRMARAWISVGKMHRPRYPIYIVSKGRADTRLTSRAFERMGVPYRIVVEPQEYKDYAAVIDPKLILKLPFSNLGQGSIPARNWIWEHSIGEGAERHWVVDDNIRCFFRMNGMREYAATGAIFAAAEDFTDRYQNIGLSGLQYAMFCPEDGHMPAFQLNTRIYSCILIDNALEFRWRGRYNEDTDLSLRVLKAGYCTVLFNAFLAQKMRTMTMAGGNMEQLYAADDGRLKMAQSLVEQHPDITSIFWRYGRWQHVVNYKRFQRNVLKLRKGIRVREGVYEYGMKLSKVDEKVNSSRMEKDDAPF